MVAATRLRTSGPLVTPRTAIPVAIRRTPSPRPAPVAAAVLALQRTAGNAAVSRAIATGQVGVQRQGGASVAVTGVRVSPARTSVPVPAGTSIRATATPRNATGVVFSLTPGSATLASGTSIDPTTGIVTVDPQQAGGTVSARATSADGSFAELEFRLVETPAAITSTSSTATGDYAAQFVHTFSSAGPTTAGLEGSNINERFASLRVNTPFGPFALRANAAGSHGWDLDASGTMAGHDTVSMDNSVDAQPFVPTASNPAPASTLPQSFSMTQNLHTKSFPSGRLGATPFTTTQHVRRLEEQGGEFFFVVEAGLASESIKYVGPPVYRNATVDQASVEASEPRPRTGAWARNEVSVTVEALPAASPVEYWIQGNALGCTVTSTGRVLVGDRAGRITVRAGNRRRGRFDAVTVTVTPRASAP
jgi:hypothetical protein